MLFVLSNLYHIDAVVVSRLVLLLSDQDKRSCDILDLLNLIAKFQDGFGFIMFGFMAVGFCLR